MKSPLYLLTILLPLATELAFASPTADVEDTDILEERDRGGDRGGFNGGNPCKVFKPYWYYKYPCESSGKLGQENQGGTFTATCKYSNNGNNWYKTKRGWTQGFNRPQRCHGNWENQQCPNPTFG
ncbi:uncharacterized protein N7469_009481 [Penicillium citrinum]|uniref:Uncharacterized protein n=1 Tax=Penicillium citrinum TaxID=5077 RepID=A0A9W9TFM1_PENCI|nr:uncharacterized protein N7469_009481 [Penicillium citrinum]KAJ5220594.1 hypothetical protein N7469_009481 [Penicillium citrinum]